ncbi:P-loop NTPase fold protein [Bacillus toyonensis]
MIEFVKKSNKKTVVLFIHGLARKNKTWLNDDKKSFVEMLSESTELKEDFDFAYLTYYKEVFPKFPSSSIRINIRNIGENLLTDIKLYCQPYENIIIVAHSIGGVIAKSCILNSLGTSLGDKIKLFLPLAVPHSNVEFNFTEKLIIKNSARLIQEIDEINMEWTVYYDELPKTVYFFGIYDKVVPSSSAISYQAFGHNVILCPDNHLSITKPSSTNSISFIGVKRQLLNYRNDENNDENNIEKILIKYNLLKEQPLTEENFSTESQHCLIANGMKELNSLKNEVLSNLNTCYMVSGYRGSGKSSFINRLEKLVRKKNNRVIFINVNFVSGEETKNVLRKLIRTLTNKFFKEVGYVPENETLYKSLLTRAVSKLRKKKFNENYLFLEILNKRTFEDVTYSRTVEFSKETKWSLTGNFAIFFVSLMLLVLYVINRQFPFFDAIKAIVNSVVDNNLWRVAPPFITFGLALIAWRGLEKNRIKRNERALELGSKTLYDDEIAEFRLKEAIDRLTNNGKSFEHTDSYKLVFVIDELDKIEDPETLKKILGQLKSLMLEGNATFIIITGQKLYYTYELEQMMEDPLLSSIISRNIHVALPSVNDFKEFFTKISVQSAVLEKFNEKNDKSLEEYIESLVLKSNRSFRTFIQLLKRDVEWDTYTGEPYILVRKDKVTALNSDILRIIEDIAFNNLLDYEGPTHDFFITQLHLIVKKIQFEQGQFKKEDLFTKIDTYPKWYWERLGDFTETLLEKMIQKNLLERNSFFVSDTSNKKILEEPYKILYKWKKEVAIYVDPEFRVITNSLLSDIENLQDAMRNHYLKYEPENTNLPFISIYLELKKKGFQANESMDTAIYKLDGVMEFLLNGQGKFNISDLRKINVAPIIAEFRELSSKS